MGKKTKASLLTMIVSISNSVIMIVINLIYNILLIDKYGSEANGLISTLTQFVSLFTIIEGGFTTASIVATYNSIVNKKYDALNDILYTTKRVFLKIGLIVACLVTFFGTIYLFFVDSPYGFGSTYILLCSSMLTTSLSLVFLSRHSVLLQGDNKEYIQVLFSLVSKIISWIISIILILHQVNIIIVFSTNIINVIINVLFVVAYEKKKYPYATYKGNYSKKCISGTKDVMFQKIANTIFSSTDLILISACINLSFASVYNMYYQVFKALLTLLSSIVQAPFNSFGQLAQEEKNNTKLIRYFSIYQHSVLIISSILLTVAGILIIPFIRIYTKNISDFNYIYPSLVLLFFSQIFAQIINRPYGTILNATGNFKMQNKQCALAAIINIIVSISFIRVWGINSIIFGSFIGTMIILLMNIFQAYKNVLKISCIHIVKNIVLNYIIAVVIIIIGLNRNYIARNYFDLLIYAIYIAVICIVFIITFNYILDRKLTKSTINYILEIIKNKRG